jgi:predicted RNase H-like nuclease (RuvC/YqgF family)
MSISCEPEERNVSPLCERIQKIEKELQELNYSYSGLYHDTSHLDEMIRNNYANEKEKIESLEKRLNRIEYVLHDLLKDDLPIRIGSKPKELEKKIEDLTRSIAGSEGRIEGITEFIHNNWSQKRREPHKCPACDGEGHREETKTLLERECVSCEGKGIVWG